MDPDKPYRAHLIHSVRMQVAELGPVDAILVTGDIAYRGLSSEYEAAFSWLVELANAAGCTMERVFVVPGNHDVDREVIRRNINLQDIQQTIANCEPNRREQVLYAQFSDPISGKTLFEPISAYNEFAARFGCQVYTPDHLFWLQDISIDERVSLRLYGLTSTILSGMNGNDTRDSLYLSPLQTAYVPLEGIVNVVLCHHPPDWFMDYDDIDDTINERAPIQFFGHRHRQRITATNGYIRFSAGAVNPARYEPGWEPGYNLINLTVFEDSAKLYLNIEAHLMNWQTSPDGFHPRRTIEGGLVNRHRISVPCFAQYHLHQIAPSIQSQQEIQLLDSPTTTDVEANMGNPKTRQLILRFWKLSTSQRREIARGLELISEEEIALSESERYGRAFLRAGERELWDKLEQEIQKMERQ